METIYVIWVSAIATFIIACFAGASFWLASRIQSRDDEFRQQISDLYKAIVISNVITFPKDVHLAIEDFKIHYEKAGGKIEIFK